jgi:hypothetical protein
MFSLVDLHEILYQRFPEMECHITTDHAGRITVTYRAEEYLKEAELADFLENKIPLGMSFQIRTHYGLVAKNTTINRKMKRRSAPWKIE